MKRLRDWLTCFVPAVPWLITAVLIVAVLTILMSALRPKVHAQFGGVQQPMFSTAAVAATDPQLDKLVVWMRADYGASNNTTGLTLTNGSIINWWYNKATLDSTATNVPNLAGGSRFGSRIPLYINTNMPNSHPYLYCPGADDGSGYGFFYKDSSVNLGGNNGTVFLVCFLRGEPYPWYGGFLWALNDGASAYNARISVNGGNKYCEQNAGTALSSQIVVPTGQWLVITAVYNGASSLLRTNGVTLLSGNAGSNNNGKNLGLNTSTRVDDNSKMNVVEWRVYRTNMTSAEYSIVESELFTRYGITP